MGLHFFLENISQTGWGEVESSGDSDSWLLKHDYISI